MSTVLSDFIDDWVDVDSLAIGLALVGKAAVVSCFCTIFIYSNEIFPTVIRTVGVGACAFFGRVGSLLAPQLLLAVKIILKQKVFLRKALIGKLISGK